MKNAIWVLVLVTAMFSGCVQPRYRERVHVIDPETVEENRPENRAQRRKRVLISEDAVSIIDPGTLEISGGLDISFSASDTEVGGTQVQDIDTTTIDTGMLYYIAQDVGIGFSFFAEREKISSGGISTDVKTLAVGPAAGFNIGLNDFTNLRFLGSLFLADVEVAGVKADGFGFGLTAGFSHFITESVSLNTSLNYQRFSLDEKTTNIGIDLDGITLGLGLSAYLR